MTASQPSGPRMLADPVPGGPGEAALRAALAEAAPALRRYAFTLGASWEDADDIAQEALLRAWQGRDGFDGRAEVRTWLFRIARNHYLDTLRRRGVSDRHRQTMTLHLAREPEAAPSQTAERAEFAAAVDRALASLPAEQREALALRESGGLSFDQIGELLGVSPNTVKSRVRYALLKLADELREFRPEGS